MSNLEHIRIDGQDVLTLRELVRPGLRAIIVGFNPSPVSVAKGHYYQGTLGKRLWARLQQYGLLPPLPPGREDDRAYELGFGFVDLVRRPTARAAALSRTEKDAAVTELGTRLAMLDDRPLLLFVFAEVHRLMEAETRRLDFPVDRFPAPYASTPVVAAEMKRLSERLAGNSANPSPARR